jgi:hypothetical protein
MFRNPRVVTIFTEKKSQAQSVSACLLMNSSQQSDLRLGPGSMPSSFKMFRTVLTTDLFDAQFPQLADDAGVAEAGCFRDLDHKLPELSGLPLPTFWILRLRLTVFFTQLSIECPRRDNGDLRCFTFLDSVVS